MVSPFDSSQDYGGRVTAQEEGIRFTALGTVHYFRYAGFAKNGTVPDAHTRRSSLPHHCFSFLTFRYWLCDVVGDHRNGLSAGDCPIFA